jgi:hypothetical protein
MLHLKSDIFFCDFEILRYTLTIVMNNVVGGSGALVDSIFQYSIPCKVKI